MTIEEQIVDHWNKVAGKHGLPKCRPLKGSRLLALKRRLRVFELEEFFEAIDAIHKSSFLRGENDRGWRPTFAFLLQEESMHRMLEGFYSDEARAARRDGYFREPRKRTFQEIRAEALAEKQAEKCQSTTTK